jgi:CubicO group peptidase (beta-lactamase class C family)
MSIRQKMLVCLLGVFCAAAEKPSRVVAAEPLPVAKPESVGLSSRRLDQIGVALRAEIARNTMPGAVVAVARKGKLVYYEAFGKLGDPAESPMPKNAIFPIFSMTKPLTAVGALELFEHGRLMLNEPVGTYLPQLDKTAVATQTGTEPARRPPTIQDMMRHTAGVTYGFMGTGDLSKKYSELTSDLSASEFLAKLGGLPLQYQPGTRWNYSLGLDVTGLAIEAITGQRLGQYLQHEVFEPLGMSDTFFAVPVDKVGRLAKPFQKAAPGERDPTSQPGHDSGGGGAFSTTADYLRFAEMLRRGGSLDNVHLLGRKTVEFMTSDQLGPEVNVDALRDFTNLNGGYGFGLSVAVRRSVGIAGILGSPGEYNWGGAGGTYFWVDPKEELTVVLMECAAPQSRGHMRQLITTLVYASLEN